MKKLICLFLQVISLTMWFVFIVDKEKINMIFNSTNTHAEIIQAVFIIAATVMLITAIIGFMIPDKSAKTYTRNNMVK